MILLIIENKSIFTIYGRLKNLTGFIFSPFQKKNLL
jgi:hypothetical protein